tara:strand:+ start:2924 stop:4441 length:1518 start_codon:yes stop_codon:yes gene_type:complete
MGVVNSLVGWYMRKRLPQIYKSIENPIDAQIYTLFNLLKVAQSTVYGKKYGFESISTFTKFTDRLPVANYEALKPFINKNLEGQQNILWPSEIKWFAKSSGTTSNKSKYIPVSFETLESCHFRGGRDMLTFYFDQYPDSKIFTGKSLFIGGSKSINKYNDHSYTGDLSAVMMNNLPFYINLISTPKPKVALMPDWEVKIEAMAQEIVNQDVTNISGVPTWTLLLLKRLLEISGCRSIGELWPNLELYFHGGVNFKPYHAQFEQLIAKKNMRFMEAYNASEGFFGMQQELNKDMLLMVDYGIFYEFIPMENYEEDNPKTYMLDQIETNKDYAVLISTNSGLWRYDLGDTIVFTSKKPYRFRITGRTKLFINAFGEELMIHNAEEAMEWACKNTGADFHEFTAAPVYIEDGKSGGHEWLIEFNKVPTDLQRFINFLDQKLKELNSDYEAKRNGNLAMLPPKITQLSKNTFYQWLKSHGKLGGQNKVPRLSNNRRIIEEIILYNEKSN